LRQGRLLRVDVDFRDGAEFKLALEYAQRFALQRDHPFRRDNLRPKSRGLDGSGDDIRRERQVSGIELEATRLRLRRQ
jgi:hypothetical protein